MIELAFDWPCDRNRSMADPDEKIVRQDEQASDDPSMQLEWLTGNTLAIIAIITAIIAIIGDFFSK